MTAYMEPERPNPEEILAAIQKHEGSLQRGKLKIFFGMAAGVGKTYAMLEAANAAMADGADIVIGVVETHGRPETEALVVGLEILPRVEIEYRGVTLREMDLEGIRARAPQIVLVDELAHTNAPGSRHAKRYQDVLELLAAGIDVWTTVNVQHMESRADAAGQITGIRVHETVPDTLLEIADQVELIDLSPEELRKRLSEGKVYTADRSDLAARNFFRLGNLTALREMSLRITAEHVDHKLQDYMEIKRISGPWRSGERLLVSVGPSPFAERLIRWTRRMAFNLEAPWLAVYVETSRPLSPEAQDQLTRNLATARSLGAEVVTTSGDDIAAAIQRVARQRNASQIVVGKSQRSNWWPSPWRDSLVDRLLQGAPDIDLFVVSSDEPAASTARTHSVQSMHSRSRGYLFALLLVAVTTAIDFVLFPSLNYLGIGLIDLLLVLLIAVYVGRGPALLAAAVSALSWDFLFIEPRLTLEISRSQDLLLFLLYFAIAIFAGNLTARIRMQERQATANAERASALYALAHETATALTMDDVVRSAVEQIGHIFGAQTVVYLQQGEQLQATPHPSSTLQLDERDFGVASWTYINGKEAGRFTSTLPSATALFLPLRTPNRTVGVLGARLPDDHPLQFDQRQLLETFAGQLALGIERELLDEAATQATLLRESERLYTTLLNSISHELRTPIAAIDGAASSLLDVQMWQNEPTRNALLADISVSANRLNRLVENLLDMSRLESGRLALKRDWCDAGEVIAAAVRNTGEILEPHPLKIEISPGLPLIQADFVLIEQVLINLLINVCAYTPPETPVRISAFLEEEKGASWLTIEVADGGPGIPDSESIHIFKKFYRGTNASTGGTGLGLAIGSGIAEAHGGTLGYRRAPEGGALLFLRLPLGPSAAVAGEVHESTMAVKEASIAEKRPKELPHG